jgi:hypothetical protein
MRLCGCPFFYYSLLARRVYEMHLIYESLLNPLMRNAGVLEQRNFRLMEKILHIGACFLAVTWIAALSVFAQNGPFSILIVLFLLVIIVWWSRKK